MDLFDYIPTTDDIVVELKIEDKVMCNPDGSPMTITVMSPFSVEAKEIVHKLNDERIQKAANSGSKTVSSIEAEAFYIRNIVETTRDWNITWKGTQPKFDKALATEIYNKAFWIRSLVEQAKAKTLNFMKA